MRTGTSAQASHNRTQSKCKWGAPAGANPGSPAVQPAQYSRVRPDKRARVQLRRRVPALARSEVAQYVRGTVCVVSLSRVDPNEEGHAR